MGPCSGCVCVCVGGGGGGGESEGILWVLVWFQVDLGNIIKAQLETSQR